jgi:nicotinate-nucleotide pyrophosphorylase (carboxylating)
MNRAIPGITDFLTQTALRRIIDRALEEDLGRGDATSDAIVPPDVSARAVFRNRDRGIIAGLDVVAMVLTAVDGRVNFDLRVKSGDEVEPGQELVVATGAAQSLLRAERVALNFLQRLSGIATLTSRYVRAVAGTKARIVDTRKTTPGLRALEKYAVRVGGGFNHRRDLGDAMLLKDNHLAVINSLGLSLQEAISRARQVLPHTLKIEVEVDRLDQIPATLAANADIILLDNMSVSDLREAVRLINGRAITEASGGVTIATVGEIASTGVDLISVGALTHSAPALDIGLDFEIA